MKPNMASESKKVQNVPSSLITQEENQRIFTSLGKQCTTLATTVTQLFLTEEPSHLSWIKKSCGVICFVKDCARRSYYFKMFDVDRSSWVWEQEMYVPFTYKTPCSFFHMFEADTGMAGLNFADCDEASIFKTTILKKLQMREERKNRKRAQQMSLQPTNAAVVAARSKSKSTPNLPNGKEEKRRTRKKKLTKEDISQPTNFLHLQHVGWHPEKGFNIENVDKELESFFNLAGVSDKDLNDSETRNFIYDFINSNGGVERAKQETQLKKSTPPPVPVRDLPQTPRTVARTQARSAAPPPPPHPPPAVPSSKHHVATAAPPPPPPPPPPPTTIVGGGGAPPPPPPPPPAPMSGRIPRSGGGVVVPLFPSDNRSALLDQIRKGKELHHVEVNGNAVETAEASSDDPRFALLNQIRQGVALKSVSTESRSPSATPMDGLAGALAKALHERNRAIHLTDESDSSTDEEDGDDEWED